MVRARGQSLAAAAAVSDTVEFSCDDCLADVLGFGLEVAPSPPLCSVCVWIRRYVPAEHQDAVRAHVCGERAC